MSKNVTFVTISLDSFTATGELGEENDSIGNCSVEMRSLKLPLPWWEGVGGRGNKTRESAGTLY
jgi:hypothetical protein